MRLETIYRPAVLEGIVIASWIQIGLGYEVGSYFFLFLSRGRRGAFLDYKVHVTNMNRDPGNALLYVVQDITREHRTLNVPHGRVAQLDSLRKSCFFYSSITPLILGN